MLESELRTKPKFPTGAAEAGPLISVWPVTADLREREDWIMKA
jgi:hypothetical protein